MTDFKKYKFASKKGYEMFQSMMSNLLPHSFKTRMMNRLLVSDNVRLELDRLYIKYPDQKVSLKLYYEQLQSYRAYVYLSLDKRGKVEPYHIDETEYPGEKLPKYFYEGGETIKEYLEK